MRSHISGLHVLVYAMLVFVYSHIRVKPFFVYRTATSASTDSMAYNSRHGGHSWGHRHQGQQWQPRDQWKQTQPEEDPCMSMRDHRKSRPPTRPPVTRSSGAASTSPSDFAAYGTAPPAKAPAPAPEPMAKTQRAPGLRLPYVVDSDTESETSKGYPEEPDYPPSAGGADFAQADEYEHPLQQMAQAQAETRCALSTADFRSEAQYK